jgi:hypothetical protein
MRRKDQLVFVVKARDRKAIFMKQAT